MDFSNRIIAFGDTFGIRDQVQYDTYLNRPSHNLPLYKFEKCISYKPT
jgi:putative transposase